MDSLLKTDILPAKEKKYIKSLVIHFVFNYGDLNHRIFANQTDSMEGDCTAQQPSPVTMVN